jgi:squalene-hopene/tetraprenyl-beta-curcumene cyclase
MDRARLEAAYQTALDALLKERHPDGYWVGELSTSALSTATAVMALHLAQAHAPELYHHEPLIDAGVDWLVAHQNDDGGWGDTDKSYSNISTTMLCRAALHLCGKQAACAETVKRCEDWLFSRYGNTPAQLAEAVRQRYGKDRTFATPILTTCALAGLVPWSEVPPLPFELACFPQSWFRFLRLHVVSYALPALIAIGQCVHHHKKPWNPVARLVRAASRKRSLEVLRRIQPSSGGYLEATPLTSFVSLSLAACGLARHPVVVDGIRFLKNSVRPDGSWPIDTNLSTWVTTLAINALAAAGELGRLDRRYEVRDWLLRQQYRDIHPYTGAAPGGWAWTPLPGGVPDADDTPGALIALAGYINPSAASAKGYVWLLGLQNADGGWPTFCRGWGHLPFDRSGADLTAHVLRAVQAGLGDLRYAALKREGKVNGGHPPIGPVIDAGLSYLARQQRPDGSWLPLWFGNQHARDDENPVYGTARVLAAYRDLGLLDEEPARRGIEFLLAAQNVDGGWGGASATPSNMEETALAVEVLLGPAGQPGAGDDLHPAVERGMMWLIDHVERGDLYNPSPIGFYFAKLWYYEKLYPLIFTVAALGRGRIQYRRREDGNGPEASPQSSALS